MKRFTIILLTILLSVAMLAVPASAEEQPFTIAYSENAAPGETVIMTVSMAEFDNVIALSANFSGDPFDVDENSKWLIESLVQSLEETEAMLALDGGESLSGPVLQLALTIPETDVKSQYSVTINMSAVLATAEDYVSESTSMTAVINVSNPATGIVGVSPSTQITLELNNPDNNTVTLVPEVTPSDHTDTLTWSSDNPDVATVSDDGVVTAVGEGVATITVKANENVQKNCRITVVGCTHMEKEWTPATEPSCTAPGNNGYYICQSCSAVLKADGVTQTTVEAETIPQADHSFADTLSYDENQHYYLCTSCGTEKDQIGDHAFIWVEDVPPTAEENGVQHEECTVCGMKRNENTPLPPKSSYCVCAYVDPATYTIGDANEPKVSFIVTKNGEMIEAGSAEYEALGLGFNVNNEENSLEAALEKAGSYTITPYCTNAPADGTVTYQSAELKVVAAGYQDAYCKTTYQIKLIEPWALRINVRVTDEASNTIDYSKVKDFGVYAIRRDQLANSEADVADMTIEDLKAEANVLHFTKADGTAEQSGQYVAITFSGGVYTYRLNQDVIWALYYETDQGVFATEVKERNLYDLMNERKDSTSATYSAEEKQVYADMVTLFDRITDYRSDFTDLSDMVLQNTDTLATTDIAFAPASTDGKYNFARVQQIGLIEPWGMRLNTRIYTPENAQGAVDYNTLTDYGVIVYHDKANAVNAENLNEAAEFLNIADKAKTYVFSGSQGTSTISGKYASSTFNDSIYTYELDSTLYYMFFAQDGDNFYYSQVYATNIRTLAADRSVSTSATYSQKEKSTYAAMVELCDSIADYREWYFSKLGE